jgi:hypothetical protein
MDSTYDSEIIRMLGEEGFWFASNPGQEAAACRMVESGILQRASSLPGLENNKGARSFFISATTTGINALPHGLYKHLILRIPC